MIRDHFVNFNRAKIRSVIYYLPDFWHFRLLQFLFFLLISFYIGYYSVPHVNLSLSLRIIYRSGKSFDRSACSQVALNFSSIHINSILMVNTSSFLSKLFCHCLQLTFNIKWKIVCIKFRKSNSWMRWPVSLALLTSFYYNIKVIRDPEFHLGI